VKSVALRVWKKPTKRSGSAAIGKSSAFCFKMHFPCRIPHQNINEIFLVCNFFAKNADIVKDVLTSCDSTLDNHISGILVSGLFWFRANQSLLLLLNAACLAEKQHIPILYSLVWHDRGSNPRSTALEASPLTSIPLMWLSNVESQDVKTSFTMSAFFAKKLQTRKISFIFWWIMCPNWATCLPADCRSSELAL
jgi:hypothetical protein